MAKKKSKRPSVPDPNTKGGTGRFVPCPAGRWLHPTAPVVSEVRWSISKPKGVEKLSVYVTCGECEPPTRTFFSSVTWDLEKHGFTIPEAEREGYRVKVTPERRAELLAELGLRDAPRPSHLPPPGLPPGWSPPPPPPSHGPYAPLPKKPKKK